MYTQSIATLPERMPPADLSAGQALRLRRVDAGLNQLRAFVGAGRRATLADDEQSWVMEACHASSASSMAGRRSVFMDTPHGRIAIGPSRDFLRVLTHIDLADDGDDIDPLRLLALDLAVQALPPAWFALFQASNLVTAFDGPAGAVEVTLNLMPIGSRVAVSTRLVGSADALLSALSGPAWQRIVPERPPLPDDWRLDTPLCVGRTTISSVDMLRLQVGDVVVVAEPAFDMEGVGSLVIGARRAKCTWHLGNRSSLEFTEWDTTTTNANMDIEREPLLNDIGDDDIDHHLDDLPVALSFEAGTAEMSLRDLRALAPGCVIPVSGVLPASVRIRSGGRVIGSGELVEIDGRLGVEIKRLGALD